MKYLTSEECRTEDQQKHCLECGAEMGGRFDRKFCSNRCKNNWHNAQNAHTTRYHDRVTRGLKSNYGILDSLWKINIRCLPIQDLAAMGFKTELCTGFSLARCAIKEYSCFEYRYRLSETRMFSLRKIDL